MVNVENFGFQIIKLIFVDFSVREITLKWTHFAAFSAKLQKSLFVYQGLAILISIYLAEILERQSEKIAADRSALLKLPIKTQTG